MWKGPLITMEGSYPFGGLSEKQMNTKHLVRKKIPKNDKQLDKARTQAHMKHDCLIKLESAQEEDGEYYLLFEYVHTAVDKWYQSVSRQFIENYEQRLILFSRYLADRGIITVFKKQSMGVTECGDAKYFLDPLFEVDSGVEKLALKKKYKEEIRQLIQWYIDKKGQGKSHGQGRVATIPDKKQNSKIQKILQAIEKGKANLCPQQSKQTALVSQQQNIESKKSTLKPIKNIQNVFIQKEINKVNKIQMIVNNKPVDILQQEFKRQYASSSFYVNGMPTVVMERERQGQTKRLLSPNDKFARFQEVKYKEYKSLKKSGELYVQDFINVLQADTQKPGSPRAIKGGIPKLQLMGSPRVHKQMQQPKLAIEPEAKRVDKKLSLRQKQSLDDSMHKISSPRQQKIVRQNIFLSEKGIKAQGDSNMKNASDTKNMPNAKTNQLQKKVSQAIANSLNAISKFKSAKGQG